MPVVSMPRRVILPSTMKAQLTCMVAALALCANAADTNKTTAATNQMSAEELHKKTSYAVGMNIGNNWKRQDIDLDVDEVAKGIRDSLAGQTKVTEEEAQAFLQSYQQKRPELNKKKAEKFLAENAKKPNIKTTKTGLQYEVLKDGTGAMPKTNDTVSVHYRGTLMNGTEFDSSYKRNQPAEFPVTGVIKGWTEALLMMKTGSKWKLYIPPDLAYGEQGRPGIPPNAPLIFEVELVAIKPPAEKKAPEEKVNAVSGEIIKVPSADELKKGAKIEVLKEEDIKKLTNNAAKPQPK